MTTNGRSRGDLTRRAVVVGGVLVIVALFVVGALVNVPRIQRDLRHRAGAALDVAGVSARVDFVGQDATLRCADPLVDPDRAGRAVRHVRGVRSVSLDASCLRGLGVTPGSASNTATSSLPPATSVPAGASTSTSSTSTTSTTLTSTTITSPTTTVPAPADLLAVRLDGGRLTMQGAVATQVQHQQLVDAAISAVDVANLLDSLAVDPSVAVSDADVASLATLIPVMSKPLASGRIGRNESGLFATGVAISDTEKGTFERAASAVGIAASVTVRPTASAADVAALAARLNAIVAAAPIVFTKGKATLDPTATAVLQQVAGVAKQFGGVVIEVQGHTDSAGDPVRNQTLSTLRAQRVRTVLVTLGVPAADLTAKGFGSSQPVTDNNGAELPDQSRRVVFGVTNR
jgi:outer membrane protein OmpA-like peptidoglycan-associated protein